MSFTQRYFVLSIVEIGQAVPMKKILDCFKCIFSISSHFPLGKGITLYFKKNQVRITQGCSVPSFFEYRLEKICLNVANVYMLFRIHLSLENVVVLYMI